MRLPLPSRNREQAIALVTVLSLTSVLTVLTVAIIWTSMTVQALKKARDTAYDQYEPGIAQVLSEYRGSAIIERFIDPNKEDIPNYTKDLKHARKSMDYFYQYRVVNVLHYQP